MELHLPLSESQPASVVGVVGIGHCPGIVAKWDQNLDTSHLLMLVESTQIQICFGIKHINLVLFCFFNVGDIT